MFHSLKNVKESKKLKNTSCTTIADILYGMPQGFILGPLLFNFDICNIFYDTDHQDIASYVDNNIPYACSLNLSTIWEKFRKGTIYIFKWFLSQIITISKVKMEVVISNCLIKK